MPRSIPANVTPDLLVWAREQSGLSLEAVARRIGVDPDRVAAWERNEAKPTVRLTKRLASVYHRPFELFFLAHPPTVTPLGAEYRRLPGVKPGAESPEFRLALRVMIQRRELALELGGESFPTFALSARISDGVPVVAARLRDALRVPIDSQLAWADEWTAWRAWRAAVEKIGVLVFQFPKVPLAEVRGLALPHFPLPAIGLNSRESAPGARVFTLIHELVHLALASAHEEDVALRERRSEAAWLEVERFAEETASHVIVPKWSLDRALNELDSGSWDIGRVRALARRFRVTPLAMATRLVSAGVMTRQQCRDWRDTWDAMVAAMPVRKGGIATPVDKTLGRAGRPLTQLVLEALDSNRITAVDASRFLDLRFDHFEALRAELGAASVARPAAE